MDMQRFIGDLLATAQSAETPRAGALYLRGTTLVQVLRVADGRVAWREEDGTRLDGTLAEFHARALERVAIEGGAATFLDRAWALAHGRTVPAATRLAVLRRFAARAPSAADAAEIERWIVQLLGGQEPTRRSPQEPAT